MGDRPDRGHDDDGQQHAAAEAHDECEEAHTHRHLLKSKRPLILLQDEGPPVVPPAFAAGRNLLRPYGLWTL